MWISQAGLWNSSKDFYEMCSVKTHMARAGPFLFYSGHAYKFDVHDPIIYSLIWLFGLYSDA